MDMVYLISVNTNISEQAASLTKYLPLESAGVHDCSTFTAHVVAPQAGGHLKFPAMFMYYIVQLVTCCKSSSHWGFARWNKS